ncbi:Probable bifunctional methylthioribulose-1-phosphate dehydratase/enolase-phosphatase E1 [Seminavis robusta]|uniref:Probable bifunctional methylthioribulose-1-phosphate dehydratase/enolase-phosphatase E1 n=1 Tax=Seminavis robusta TaxID=568900 RepID=A0A9N8EUL3_9STRA|nr:Probable bifunctional methylthioribulose-1-phosphate dehydratase/enolase-phosphatase E1 [Seminavis robusta]|eukprot:Sro1865_g302470.1 Probable bifunctional methylthioribulose-1-phosphate dehydratase/enolase-phosphatase E1 (604) ;mRNA; f:16971-18879
MNGTSNKDTTMTDASKDKPGYGWSNGEMNPQMFPVTRDGRIQLYSRERRWIHVNDGWTRLGGGANEHSAVTFSSQSGDALTECRDEEARTVRSLIAQLCETFYQQGWATGTGGGCSIRVGGPSENRPWRVFVAPSGIQKEDMVGDDVFELDMDRNVVVEPKTPNLRQSACTPLWYVVYRNRPNTKCVIHTHSMNAQMATLLDPTETANTLNITHLEMLKGVGSHAYDDQLEIPIIDNRPSEDLLADQLEAVIQKYPKCNAVLVRRHGVYVWGDSWESAKTQCESFDYLFQSAVQMKTLLHMDPGLPPKSGTYRVDNVSETFMKTPVTIPRRKKAKPSSAAEGFNGIGQANNRDDLLSNAVPILPRDAKVLLLDVEGCTTSISFVKDQLFPYVLDHLDDFVDSTLQPNKQEYQETVVALTADLTLVGQPIPEESKNDVKWMVRKLMEQDIKVPGLKTLQGKMWKVGYERGTLHGHVYSDVWPMLQWMKTKGCRVCIFSSGSVQAQKLLLGHSVAGNLCDYVEAHFDIPTAGNKKMAGSYKKIAEALGVSPWHVVFCSDSEAELVAAKEAGIGYQVMTIRPGNAPISDIGKEYPEVYSLLQLCGE